MTNYTAIHYKILGALMTMDSMISTAESIAGFFSLNLSQVKNAIARLTTDQMIATRGQEIFVTEEGEELFKGAVKKPALEQDDYYAWVREALSGTDDKGHQSTINNAALPSNRRQPRRNPSGSAHDNMIDLARKLHLETMQCAQWVKEGKIKECNKCKELAVHPVHKGLVRTPCNKCRAKNAEKRRKK